MEEKKVSVTLAEKQHLGGVWHYPGDTVEVYEQEAYALTKRGKVEPGTGVQTGFVNLGAATDVETEEPTAPKKKSGS